jgi:hypothetical protein
MQTCSPVSLKLFVLALNSVISKHDVRDLDLVNIYACVVFRALFLIYCYVKPDRVREPEKQPLLDNGYVNTQQYQSHR